ncbi:hypothetical protein KAS31_02165 [Candidatus Parcubacteria bacterium]|nr:hypothetical protein [Candidatus Parcubacteria bacterium]
MTEIITSKPEIIKLYDKEKTFGEIREITSKELGAKYANFAEVTLWGPDFLHLHKRAEETYVCLEGKGEIILDGIVYEFIPETRIVISPGTLHAVRPKTPNTKVVFYCVSSPPFNPNDVYNDKLGRDW